MRALDGATNFVRRQVEPCLEAMGLTVDRSRLDYEAVFRKSRAAADRLSKGVQGLLVKNKVDLIPGTGTIVRSGQVFVDGKQTLHCKNILVATSSRSKDIGGFQVDEKRVLSSTGLLMLEKLLRQGQLPLPGRRQGRSCGETRGHDLGTVYVWRGSPGAEKYPWTGLS
jgi:pyruvate/2-oxoglutarate dehydrogenase complex dihydrolipoamide dehydrogenase (E3) component